MTDVWSGQGPVIVDTSAWITARRMPERRELLLAAIERGDVAWCWPVRYELTVDARDAEAIGAVDQLMEALREVRVDASVQRHVLATMRELAASDAHGAHRLPLTDLTVAVAARASGLGVLHFDRDFDRLSASIGVDAWWLADPGETTPN